MSEDSDLLMNRLENAKNLEEFMFICSNDKVHWPVVSGGWGRDMDDSIVLTFDNHSAIPEFEMYIIKLLLMYEGYAKWEKVNQRLRTHKGRDIDEITIKIIEKGLGAKNGESISERLDPPISRIYYFDITHGISKIIT